MNESTYRSPGQILRDSIDAAAIQVVGAPNALAGRLIQQMGYDAAYLSGAVVSASVLALPDLGFHTLTELVQQATYLTRSVEIPLIVDAGGGFGDVLNVQRTVIEIEAAGAAAIQMDDQDRSPVAAPQAGKSLVSAEALCEMIRAAVAARADADFILVARTDARGVHGFDEAVARARQYVSAGADWIFPDAMETADEFEQFARQVEVPLIANMTEFGRGPLLSLEELAEMGYSVALYPATLQSIALKAMEAALALLATDGTQQPLLDLMQTPDELNDLLDFTP